MTTKPRRTLRRLTAGRARPTSPGPGRAPGRAEAGHSSPGQAGGPGPGGAEIDPSSLPIRTGFDRWDALTRRSLAELAGCDPDYRPTNFWGPGLHELMIDMAERGLTRFKSWPTSGFWFYPVYGQGFTNASMEAAFRAARAANPKATEVFMKGALGGALEARRDFDAARLAWDHARWPFRFESTGESRIGSPPQYFRLSGHESVGWGRAYLNYLLCLSALSQHVTEPPRSFLEIGGGFGVLGEIVLSRDSSARYVNLDIPPLLTVSSYYLTELFGAQSVMTYDDRVPSDGPVSVTGTACLPNWRVEDLQGGFDVFVNSFSFQEMEPAVVRRYVAAVGALGVRYVVSLNSEAGKPRADGGSRIGVIEPVTSSAIVKYFEAEGYRLCAAYGQPLLRSAGQLVVLTRD